MPPEALDPVLTSLDALVISSRRACVLFEFFFFFFLLFGVKDRDNAADRCFYVDSLIDTAWLA